MAQGLGIDLVHLGVVMVANLMIGTLTPPFGMMTYVAAGIAKVPLHAVFRELLPFLLALAAVLVLITYVPGLVLWLPGLLG